MRSPGSEPQPRQDPLRGASLLEVSIALAVFTLLLFGATTLVSRTFDFEREDETVAKLLELKQAIVGDVRIVTREARTDFGYLGDTGNLPTSLDQLWTATGIPTYTFDTTLKVGTGWAGPYVGVPTIGRFEDIIKDGWGTDIVYEVVNADTSPTGQIVRARLISYGPNTSPGGGDDLTVEVYETQVLANVAGYVRDAAGNPLPGVTTTLYYPTFAVLTNQSLATDENGAFNFTNVPFGNRSLLIEPQLVYVQETAVTTGGQSNDIEFVIQNYSASDVTINSITVTHDADAYWENLRLGNSTVFTYTTNRVASGVEIAFPDETITGTGSISGRTFPIRVQSGFSLTPDQDIGEAAKKGGTLRIELQNFVNTISGAGANVDMTGTSFEVEFSDGSTSIFTTVRQ